MSFLGPAVDAPRWVTQLSPWAHVAVAPPDAVNWRSTLVMAAAGAACCAIGISAFARRDLR